MRELSKKNPYWLPKDRYLEMKHFALQYDYWKEEVNAIDILGTAKIQKVDSEAGDPVWTAYERRSLYLRNMAMVKEAADETDIILGYFIFLTATKGSTYENLKLMHGIPCNRNDYYNFLRRFYFILSGLRM